MVMRFFRRAKEVVEGDDDDDGEDDDDDDDVVVGGGSLKTSLKRVKWLKVGLRSRNMFKKHMQRVTKLLS